MSSGPVVYRSLMSDNLRWYALRPRAGDIVISAPPKCGVTWTQRLVSLLIFDGPQLPGPMSTVSPWLDQTIRPIEEVVATLDAQSHRRFLKTHTPLDGLVLDDRVTYICVGRDPRDAAMSQLCHAQNVDADRLRQIYAGVPGPPGLPPPHPGHHDGHRGPERDLSPPEALRTWLEAPAIPVGGMPFNPAMAVGSLAHILHHFSAFWRRRGQANVAGFHYSDYQSDLVGELIRLAAVLGYRLGRERAEELAGHASLEVMRGNADALAPNTTDGMWRSNERFFRTGGHGEWRDLFTEADLRRYRQRVTQLAPPDLLDWAHRGQAIPNGMVWA
jgi:hypothetical protein